MATLTVEREDGTADRAAFIDLPYRLYAGHPVWVPPLRMAERDLMNRAKNPFFAHAEVEHFLARRAGRVVGRIAAIEHRETRVESEIARVAAQQAVGDGMKRS